MKLVMFNGPPDSGKDTAADYLALPRFGWAIKLPIAMPLKRKVHRFYGIPDELAFAEPKNKPSHLFGGITPRAAYIAYGEAAKKVHGERYWVNRIIKSIANLESFNIYADSLWNATDRLYIISDIGFSYEIEALCEFFGKDRALLFVVEREGTDYRNDSRQPASQYDIPCKSVYLKNDILSDFLIDVRREVDEWKI